MVGLRISIALCTYNGEKYIREQLGSIASQTRQPDELVIRDDVSDDRTIEIIKDFERTVIFPIRVYINERRLGSTLNFARAIQDCAGELIVLSDQDDVWIGNKLALIESVFSENPDVDVVFSDAQVVDEALKPLGFTLWASVRFSKNEQAQVESGTAMRALIRHNMVQGAAMAFRSRIRDRILPIPADVMHDAWIAMIAGVVGLIKPISEPLILYRQHGRNQLGANSQSGIVANAIELMRAPRASHVETIRSTLRLYEQAFEHLRFIGADQSLTNLADDLTQKVEHTRRRLHIALRDSRWLTLLLKELFRMRYHRYSFGWWSAVHDLIRGTLQR